MKAVVYSRYGPPEVLSVAEVPQPVPSAGEVLVRVRAAEVTKADCELRSFKFPVQWFWLPLRLGAGIFRPRRPILGGYFAGEVVATSGADSRFTVGEAVFGCAKLRMGTHAEYVCLPETYTMVAKPENMSFAEAAAVPLGALNALHFLNLVKLQAGEELLIIGGGGSIGLWAIQIAKARGAQVTVVDKTSKSKVVREAGADRFIDYTRTEYQKSGHRYDVVFSMVAGGSFKRGMGVLKPRGRYVIGNPRLSDMVRAVGTSMGSSRQAYFAFAGETMEELQELKVLIEAGTIRAQVDSVYPLEAAAEAHRRVETEQRNGAIVLEMK